MKHLIMTWLSILLTMMPMLTMAEEPSSAVQQLASLNGEFALDLYRQLTKETHSNIIFSPISISTAFAMVYLGADGNTKIQMYDVLKFKDSNDSELHQSFKVLLGIFDREDNQYVLDIANRLFGQQDQKFREDYLSQTSDLYRAPLEKLDFSGDSEGSRNTINRWVAERTEQKIQDLLPEGLIKSDTIFVLVNAVYFKGVWKTRFNTTDTTKGLFHLGEDKNTEVNMMTIKEHQEWAYSVVPELQARLLSMPYQGEDVTFNILLPDEINGLSKVESQLSMKKLNEASKMARKTTMGVVSIPKFQLKQKAGLVEVLNEMGMTDLFQRGVADLSGITGANNLFVSEVVHEAYIEVNEEGTEAAAATAVVGSFFSAKPEPQTFVADHPFLFFIREESTGSILFLGRFTEPQLQDSVLGNLRQYQSPPHNSAAQHTVPFLVFLLTFILGSYLYCKI